MKNFMKNSELNLMGASIVDTKTRPSYNISINVFAINGRYKLPHAMFSIGNVSRLYDRVTYEHVLMAHKNGASNFILTKGDKTFKASIDKNNVEWVNVDTEETDTGVLSKKTTNGKGKEVSSPYSDFSIQWDTNNEKRDRHVLVVMKSTLL